MVEDRDKRNYESEGKLMTPQHVQSEAHKESTTRVVVGTYVGLTGGIPRPWNQVCQSTSFNSSTW